MSRHAAFVVVRAAAATLAIGLAAQLVVPAYAVIIAVAGAVGVIAFEVTRVAVTFTRRFDELAADLGQTQPLLELERMLPTRLPLPPLQGYAIAPDAAVLLVELIAREKPKLVVETGSGVSTLVIAYALEKLGEGGRVIALDHAPPYAARTRALIVEHGLEAIATVRTAPLEPIEIQGKQYQWYARRAVDDIEVIDLVFDDGPPRHAGPMLRYASLHVLGPKLAPRGTFVLDVVGSEERDVLARWQRELPELEQERVATKKGNVLIRRR
ncbi:MAG: class I SAM-dependent methyltransferase [Deltaproteobacteria bacterium]|nr:class I SAM-dependent methyltransferase [Deltaproteobacteria bacterium]